MARDTQPQKPPTIPQVIIDDFGGLVSNLDPQDLPIGSAIHQVNAIAAAPAELRVRGGTRLVTFDPVPPR